MRNLSSALALLASACIALAACSSGDDGSPPPNDPADQSLSQAAGDDAQSAQSDVEAAAREAESMEGIDPDDEPADGGAGSGTVPSYQTAPPAGADGDPPDDDPTAGADAGLANLLDLLAIRYPDHEGFAALPLETPPGEPPLFAAYSTGFAPFPAGHVFGVFEASADAVVDLGVVELESFPSFIFDDGATQVRAADGGPAWGDDLWFEIQGGAGAHGSSFELLRFNRTDGLRTAVSWGTGIPFGAGTLIDLDEDGVPEVVLDLTNADVFCYACGVRLFDSRFLRWDAAADGFIELGLEPLSADAEPDLREAVDSAIALAQADLWQDAAVAIGVARRDDLDDPTVLWNAIQINWIAEARLDPEGPYPLLEYVFGGRYQAAVDSLAPVDPIDLIDMGPIAAGEAAFGHELVVAELLVDYAGRALAVRPELAPALFLRGLGRFWLAPDQADLAITDVNEAARLDPDQPLYEAIANFLTP